jgi:hypothetical protein
MKSRRSRRFARLAVLAATACLLVPGSAAAFDVDSTEVPWPYDTISYFDDSAFKGSVAHAVQKWNARNTGYRFVPVDSREDANVFVFTNNRTGPCTGRTLQGYYFGQSIIRLNGNCDRYVMALGAAHELGHLLTLGHDDDECAVMNSTILRGRPLAKFARPSACAPRREYWRNPVRSDDAEGGEAARRRPFRFPLTICYPADEERSPAVRQEGLCRAQYDCRGVPGTAPARDDDPRFAVGRASGATGSNRPFAFLDPCEESEYDPNLRVRSAIVGPPPGMWGPVEVFGTRR